MAKKYVEPGNRIMDIAWFRDKNGIIYTGEALNLAMLMHNRKDRTVKQEEELKDLLNVFEESKTRHTGRGPENKKHNSVR